jgi:hypothetical protein
MALVQRMQVANAVQVEPVKRVLPETRDDLTVEKIVKPSPSAVVAPTSTQEAERPISNRMILHGLGRPYTPVVINESRLPTTGATKSTPMITPKKQFVRRGSPLSPGSVQSSFSTGMSLPSPVASPETSPRTSRTYISSDSSDCSPVKPLKRENTAKQERRRRKFDKVKMRSSETLFEYAKRLGSLFAKAYPGEKLAKSELMGRRFVDTVSDEYHGDMRKIYVRLKREEKTVRWDEFTMLMNYHLSCNY